MVGDDRQHLEQVQALLAQARADRDRLQERVLYLEDQLGPLRRIPLTGAANQLRKRWAGYRRRKAAVPVYLPGHDGPARPGRFIDVSNLSDPARTGIARVTIRLARELGYGLVVARDGHLVHDTAFIEEIHGRAPSADESDRNGTPLIPGPGVLVLDPAIQLDSGFSAWQQQIRDLRSRGGVYVQIVHDLLPIELPDFFDHGMRQRFPQWLAFVTDQADLILTDSAATASTLEAWLSTREVAPRKVPIRPWRLGSDPLPPSSVTRPDREGPRLLVVGTVEPRKALDVVVDAVTQLRASGVPAEMVLVGLPGWADTALTSRLAELAAAPWFSWLADADDHTLADQYASCDLLVAASRGEGFGLPVAEALANGLPVVARDLPVFRELLGPTGTYFALDRELAAAVLTAWQTGTTWTVEGNRRPLVTWAESARAIADIITATDGFEA